jgi:tetrahydromethanopterin S-methyltransferase subunit C
VYKLKDKINKWIVMIIFLLLSISLLVVYNASYGSDEAHFVRALPLSIAVGLTAIATAISQKD